MRPCARSSRRVIELLLVASLFGCGLGKSGTASVAAEFDELECQSDRRNDALEDYRFEAGYLSTERFSGILLIMILKHRVNVEETDGLSVRIDLDELIELGELTIDPETNNIVRPDPSLALRLPVSQDPGETNATLSLFQTCPELPINAVRAGELELTNIVLQEDPQDTGRMEHLTGTLTGTMTRSNVEGRVGALRAEFDFAPPRRPLSDFK